VGDGFYKARKQGNWKSICPKAKEGVWLDFAGFPIPPKTRVEEKIQVNKPGSLGRR